MSAALDPVWIAYQQAVGALKIVRRAVNDPALAARIPGLVKGTEFDGIASSRVDPTIDSLQEHLDDQTVLSLYAAFESALRDHLIAQAVHLRAHASKPDASFAAALADEYESWCDEHIRMDRVAALFLNAMGQTPIVQIAQIRKYRHWLVHGKRRPKPSQTTPAFAYQTLERFLAKL